MENWGGVWGRVGVGMEKEGGVEGGGSGGSIIIFNILSVLGRHCNTPSLQCGTPLSACGGASSISEHAF